MTAGTKELYQLDDSMPLFYTIGNLKSGEVKQLNCNGTTNWWQSRHEKPVLTTPISKFFPPVVFLGGKLGKTSSFPS